jgi:hypothetical protein
MLKDWHFSITGAVLLVTITAEISIGILLFLKKLAMARKLEPLLFPDVNRTILYLFKFAPEK